MSHIPKCWKKALVTLIPKPFDGKRSLNEFRPISLLSVLSKICERIIGLRIDHWTTEFNLISCYQSGFVKGRQTRDHILRLIQDAQSAFNINHKVGAIVIDKEKAFDGVWHSGLLCKLHSAKIPPYLGSWIKDYLSNRSFVVRISGELSSEGFIEAGVPQGSVLGPKLFNFFFNDIGRASTKNNNVSIAMFADDFAAWKASRSKFIIEKELQLFLDNIREWTSRWRMKLNERKTVYNIFTKKAKIEDLNLQYNGLRIARDPSPKFLGVKLDSRLDFSVHIQSIKEKCFQRTNMLKKLAYIRGGLSRKVKIKTKLIVSLYKALVQPVIDYCPFITIMENKTVIKKMERLQNQALRAASKWPIKRSNKEMLKELKIESVLERHRRISKSYIKKASRTNPIIKNKIKTYKKAWGVIDGYYNHNRRNKQNTVFSKLIRIKRLIGVNKIKRNQNQREILQREYSS